MNTNQYIKELTKGQGRHEPTNRKHKLVHRLAIQIQDVIPATRSMDLTFRTCSCRIYSNSPALLRKLRGDYRRFVSQVPAPDYLVTILNTPPVLLNSAYDLCLPEDLVVESKVADDLEGIIVHDRTIGMMSVTGGGRYVLLGPALDHTEAVQHYIYDLYQQWNLKAQSEQSRPA